MTAAEKREAAHVRMREAYDRAIFQLWKEAGYSAHQGSFRAGFLAALRYTRDEMPRVLTDGELERVGAA